MKRFYLSIVLLIIVSTTFGQLNLMVFDTTNSGLPNNWTTSIAVDSQNNIWIGSPISGLTKYDGTNWTVYDTTNSDIPSNNIFRILIGANGKKYIGTDKGFSIFNDTTWINYDMSNSTIASNWVSSLFLDSASNLWIGTTELTKFDGINWINYNSSNSNFLTPTSINNMTSDSFGNFWIGCASGNYNIGLYKFDGINFTPIQNLSNCPSATKFDMQEILWQSYINCSSNYGGVGKYVNNIWTNYTTQNSGIPDDYVNDISFDSLNNPWITTYSMGIARFDGTAWVNYNPQNSNFPAYCTARIIFDLSNRIWITTRFNGVISMEDIFTDVYENPNTSEFQLYPNPFSLQAILKTEKPLNNATLIIYNSFGQIVKQINNISEQTITLNRDKLISGVYILRLSQDDRALTTSKLIITD